MFALNYGQRPPGNPVGGTAHVADSARELSAFVDRVLAATGTSQVDIVGHSQGGMMPRYYMRFLGGTSKVHALVGLVPSNHGTTAGGLATLAAAFPGGTAALAAGCPACTDQFAGSPFMQRLNAGGDTEPGVSYTVITTRNDEVVTPYTSAFLSGPNVTDIVVQRQCARRHARRCSRSSGARGVDGAAGGPTSTALARGAAATTPPARRRCSRRG